MFIPSRGSLIAVNRDWNSISAEAGLPEARVASLRHSIGTAGIVAACQPRKSAKCSDIVILR